MNRFQHIKYTLNHRKEVQRIANRLGYSFPLHDLDKILLYPFLGVKLTHKLHRRFSKHHVRNNDVVNKVEAAIDWESARFTKPDKPLDAYDTWMKYYPEVDMEDTLKSLGLWK